MKDSTVVRSAVVIAGLALVMSCIGDPQEDTDTPSTSSTTTSSVVTTTAEPTTTTTTPTTTIEEDKPARAAAYVTRVVDGDTLDAVVMDVGDVRIRLIGIDTPEVYGGTECYGPEASARAKELAEGARVSVEVDPTQDLHDRYGRLLAYVWLDDDTMLNEVLVAEGFAEEYLYDQPYTYRDRLVLAEMRAQENDLGLWRSCR